MKQVNLIVLKISEVQRMMLDDLTDRQYNDLYNLFLEAIKDIKNSPVKKERGWDISKNDEIIGTVDISWYEAYNFNINNL